MFSFRLAIQCGYPHPRMMLEQMSASEWNEVLEYAQVEPFGEFRAELRHGQIMAFHANMNRDEKKKREPFKAIDFMNFTDKPEEKGPTPADDQSNFDKWCGLG